MTNQRSVLITGCSTGIGRVGAEILRQRGWRVFATARKPEDVAKLKEAGFESCQLDLDEVNSIRQGLAWVLERSGGTLDGLFNNGAYGQPGAVEDITIETLRAQFETNVFGTHELTRLAIPVMRQQGHGRIVQNSSVLGFVSLPYRGAYNASKYALEGLSDTLRLELHGTGIHVSLIEPGPITTRFRANALAAFLKNVDTENTVHKESYKRRIEERSKEGETGRFSLPPEAVVKHLIHALESPHPKASYYVTFPTYLFGYLKRVLPRKWLDRILMRAL
ncbi:MAG: SDR family oxidoreductase [Magnetococcales bacterium]|nr:SDR family oxidoreductase [Magnetococcales bacterium]